MSFSYKIILLLFSSLKKQEEKSNKKEETFAVFYNLSVVVQMDVAGRACTLTLAIAANRSTLAARMSFKCTPVPNQGMNCACIVYAAQFLSLGEGRKSS